jgi:hypothetical protein
MNDAYTTAFFDAVRETQNSSGYDLPEHIEAYVVMLLSSYVDKDDFPPESTVTVQYLSLKDSYQAKDLGDTCLFISGAFPNFKKRHGVTRRFYQDIGSSSYDMASAMNDTLFPTLAKHFVFLSDFIDLTINSPKHELSSLFR